MPSVPGAQKTKQKYKLGYLFFHCRRRIFFLHCSQMVMNELIEPGLKFLCSILIVFNNLLNLYQEGGDRAFSSSRVMSHSHDVRSSQGFFQNSGHFVYIF